MLTKHCTKKFFLWCLSSSIYIASAIAAEKNIPTDTLLAKRNYQQILEITEPLLTNNPNKTSLLPIHLLRGQASLALSDLTTANDSFTKALEHDEYNLPALMGMAQTKALQRSHQDAKYLIKKGLAIAPKHAGLLSLRAYLYQDAGKYDNALSVYHYANKHNVQHSKAKLGLVSLFMLTSQLDAYSEFPDTLITMYKDLESLP